MKTTCIRPHQIPVGCPHSCTAPHHWREFFGGFHATDQSDKPSLLCRRRDRGGIYLSLSIQFNSTSAFL